MRNPPPFPQGEGKYPECLRWLFDAVRSLEPIAGPGEIVEHTSRGVRRRMDNSQTSATSAASFKSLIIVREGRDALVCVEVFDGPEIVVLKPFDLRVRRKIEAPVKFGRTQPTTFDTTYMDALPAFWGNRGMVVEVVDSGIANEAFNGNNSGKQHQAIWPMYVPIIDSGASNQTNRVVEANQSYPIYILAVKVSASVAQVSATLQEVDSGGTPCSWLDMNIDKRSWKTVSEITMEQSTKMTDGGNEYLGVIYNE